MTTALALRFTLANGLRVIVEPDNRHDLVAVAVSAGAGSRDDPAGARGMAHLVEHLMFPREQAESAGHVRTVEAAGGLCDAVTHRDHTSYYSIAGADLLDMLLESEALRLRRFAPSQSIVDSELPVIEEEIRGAELASRGGYPWTVAASALFGSSGDHGVMADLRTVTADDAISFHRKHYAPNNLVLSVVGAVDPHAVEAAAHKAFGSLVPVASVPSAKLVARPGVHTTHTSPGFRGVAAAVATPLPDDTLAYVAHGVLAEIMTAFRLRSGTAYCGFHGEWFNTGAPDLFVTLLLNRPEWTDAVSEVDALLDDLGAGGPTEAELRRAVATLLLAHHRQLDSLATRAVALGRFELLFPGIGGPSAVPELLERVSVADVAAAARAVRSAPRALVELSGGAR